MTGLARRTATGVVGALLLVAPALSACTDDSGSSEAFCRQVGVVPPLASVVSGFAEADPAALDDRLDEARRAYADLRDSAPADIRGEVTTVVELVDQVIAAVAANDGDPEATAEELRAAVSSHEDAASAASKVADYAERRCGVELNPTVPGDVGGDRGDETSTSTSVATSTTKG